MSKCICELIKDGDSKLLSSRGDNNMLMEYTYGEYRIVSMKDNGTNIVNIVIRYCPICGRNLKEVVSL